MFSCPLHVLCLLLIIPSILSTSCPVRIPHSSNCTLQTILTLEVAVAYDISFCALYNRSSRQANKAIRAAFASTSGIFKESVCIQVVVRSIDSHCHSNSVHDDDPFGPSSWNLANDSTLSPSNIIEEVRDAWRGSVSGTSVRDAVFVFTGSGPSDIDGAAYVEGACSFDFGFAWVPGKLSIPVIVHEIGHLLGAVHAPTGFLGPRVRTENPSTFDPASISEIKSFIAFPKAWCLRRRVASFGTLQKRHKWSTPVPLAEGHTAIDSLAFLPHSKTLMILLRQKNSVGVQRLELHNLEVLSCDQDVCERNETTAQIMTLNISVPSEVVRTAMAYVYDDLFVGMLVKGKGAFYRVTRRFKYGDAQMFGDLKRLPLPPNSDHDSIIAISLSFSAHYKTLTFAIALKAGHSLPRVYFNLATVDINTKKVKWGDFGEVPSYFGHGLVDVSASLVTLHGRDALVTSYFDDTQGIKSGFIRVLRDVNSNEINAWSEEQQIPVLFPYASKIRGNMALTPPVYVDGGEIEAPTVVVVQRSMDLHGLVWKLNVAVNALGESFICSSAPSPFYLASSKLARKQRIRTGVQMCKDCFSKWRKCKKTVHSCIKQMGGTDIDVADSQKFGKTQRGLFCSGLLLTGVCRALSQPRRDTIKQVLMVELRDIVKKANLPYDVKPANQLEALEAGINGKIIGRGVVAKFEFKSKEKLTRKALSRALAMLKKRFSFVQLHENILEVRCRNIRGLVFVVVTFKEHQFKETF